MSFLFPVLGWLAAIACLAFALSSMARAVRLPGGRRLRRGRKGIRPGAAALAWACLAAACLTGLGAIGLLPGIIASVVLAVISMARLRRSGRPLAHLAAGVAWATQDAAALSGRVPRPPRLPRLRGGGQSPDGDDDPDGPDPGEPARPRRAPRPAPAASGDGGAPPWMAPPLREDPALGPAPAPEVAAAAGAVPVPWAELAAWIAGYVPEDDNAQSAFLTGIAAGVVAVADAIGAHSETVINDIGLDPAYGSALLEVAGRLAETAGDVALADQRYHVIYGELKRAVEDGLILPHRTREWFGAGDGGTAAA